MKYIGTMLSVFQRHSCICQVIIWTPEGPISYASESLIVIFLPWYNCCVYVLNGNKMFLNWIDQCLQLWMISLFSMCMEFKLIVLIASIFIQAWYFKNPKPFKTRIGIWPIQLTIIFIVQILFVSNVCELGNSMGVSKRKLTARLRVTL